MPGIATALGLLRTAHDQDGRGIIVGFSGGKDSLVTLSLCQQVFSRVEPFFMYFIPGLESAERTIEATERRTGLQVHRVQHWMVAQMLRRNTFRPNVGNDVPSITMTDIEATIRERTGLTWFATGEREDESMLRRARLRKCRGIERERVFPIWDWSTGSVRSYLQAKRIPLPPSRQTNQNGVDLSVGSLIWLRDNFPDDYRRILEVFPYAETQIKRREFFGEDL